MQITETASDGLKREFKVVVDKQDIEKKVSDRLGEIGRTIRMPGFRWCPLSFKGRSRCKSRISSTDLSFA